MSVEAAMPTWEKINARPLTTSIGPSASSRGAQFTTVDTRAFAGNTKAHPDLSDPANRSSVTLADAVRTRSEST